MNSNYFRNKVSLYSRLIHQFLFSREFLFVLFSFFLATRLIHLLADPPKTLDFSLGLFFDEGIYNHNVRNQILFGQWKLDEWNDFYYSALSTWLKYLVFRLIGIGRAQIRLFSIAFSMVSLIFAYLASKESYGKRTGLIAVLLLGTNYIYLMFNRLGMQDTQPIAVFLISFYFWQKGMNLAKVSEPAPGLKKWTWYCFLAGVVCFTSYTFKNLVLYLLPAPFVTFGLYLALQFRDKPLRAKLLKAFGYFSAGVFLAFLIWYLPFYLPNRAIIIQFGSFFAKTQMFPITRLSQLLRNIYQTPFFLYFSYNPIVLLGSLFFLWSLYYLLCSEMRSRIQSTDIFLTMWFWAAFAFTGIIAYRPTRYFLPIIPPMCLLAARFMSSLHKLPQLKLPKKLHWSFFLISVIWLTIIFHYCILPWGYRAMGTKGLIASTCFAVIITGIVIYLTKRWQARELRLAKYFPVTIAVALIAFSLYKDGKYYYRWARSPEYVVSNTGKDIMTQVGRNGYIGGMDAPGVAYDTPYKTLISWDQYVNYAENPITKYKLTHLFLANNRNIQEDHYYFQRYPREMRTATLLQQYPIKDATFSLFSLVEIRLENLTLAKTTFSPRESLETKIRMKNYDFRQPGKLFLNWFLYPLTLTQDANPVSMGQERQYWLPPEHEQDFSLTGNLPEQSGQYILLVSWNTGKESRCEAENMRRQIGQIVEDINAAGNRVVYHDTVTSPGTGFLAYGHYRDYQPGVYETVFRLKIGDRMTTDDVVRLDVAANYGKVILQQRELRQSDFSDTRQYQSIILPYFLKDYTRRVEFRVFSYGKTDVWVDEIHTVYREGVWYREPIIIKEKPDEQK
jgi:4-amino-4-deoxy-L-arabinose transferase-like glycosyltransferase